MKKSNFAKILTLVLVCAALIGAVVGINASAANEQTVEFVSNNVWYGEDLRLAYAVACEDDVEVTLYLDEGLTVRWCNAYQDGTREVNGVECKKFYAEKGVPIQDINTYVYAVAKNLATDEVDVQRYSVLEYLYQRLGQYGEEDANGNPKVTENQKAMYEAHLAYAEAAEQVIYVENTNNVRPDYSNTIADTSYVVVNNGLLEEKYTAGVYANDTNIFEIITANEQPGEGQKLVWRDVNNNNVSVNTETYVLKNHAEFIACIEDEASEDEVIVPEVATYTFSNYTAGSQYAENEEHVLDDNITMCTTQAHFTAELRIYSSSTHDGYAIIKCTANGIGISSITLNAGNNADTIIIYGSNDGGETWIEAGSVTTTGTSYNNYTAELNGCYQYLKLDVKGTKQVRIKSMTITFGAI